MDTQEITLVLRNKMQAVIVLLLRLIGVLEKQVAERKPAVPVIPAITVLPSTIGTPSPSRLLFDKAVECLGKDMAPDDDELGCAEAVNEINFLALGDYVGGGTSTYRMFSAVVQSVKYKRVTDPKPGDIILSPTGMGNGTLPHGHAGIVGENDGIMSNDSVSGFWEYNYTISTWRARYQKQGGFPVYFFRRISR